MAQSVSNEALWVKLSEMDKKLDKLSEEQESPVPTQEPAGSKPDLTAVKEEIITKIKDEITILGRSSDSHFDANKKNIGAITEIFQKIWNIVSRIRKQQREAVELQETDKVFYFDFRFFKVRKTSFVITVLGILVFILTLFCMKQQNEYSLLIDGYYRQHIVIRQLQSEVDSLRNVVHTSIKYKK
ncbi:MAG TPA: hypothetical protein PKC55_14315 [Dysgonomonas sp.]|uniref:Uncharacterized protein n=1 Tax=uncultured Dysgonomonas sp. TaxID=206096 RepID=A0A212J7M1_9BACT|nr:MULTISPECIES: hypothetical protein [unclassified Dysgonomonas]SBV95414.1 conserved hypothetical protein [uncultured Dysgonomonas sp.]HML66001.1 hypothetical protein [Dysgonomonas sp.]